MPYRPENEAQERLDRVFRQLGGQVVPLRVDWAKRLGSIHAAVVLQQLLFESRQHADDGGWFYLTAADMEDLTAVGERGYAAARGALEKLGLIETEKRGMPLRLFLRFDLDALAAWIADVDDQGTKPSSTPRSKLRHMAEQAPPYGGTSSAMERDMLRPKAAPNNESRDESSNERGISKDLPISGGSTETTIDEGLARSLIADLARELGDEAALSRSVARAVNLWQRSGADRAAFVAAIYEARNRANAARVTKTREGAMAGALGSKNRMPYFFAALEDLLGLKSPPG